MHTSVFIKFGAVFTDKEVKACKGLKPWLEEGCFEHPHVNFSYAGQSGISYLYIKGSSSVVYSRYDEEGDCADPLLGFLKGNEAEHRKNFLLSCEELGLPYREPKWLLVRSYD